MAMKSLKGKTVVVKEVRSEEEIRAAKRVEQRRDIAAIRSGQVSGSDLIWFSKDLAGKARALNSPY